MRDLVENIRSGNAVRQNILQLKESLKEASDIDAFLQYIQWDLDFFRELLRADDPKVRKNAIQLIGLCGLDELTEDLFAAYWQEETRYLRADYLKVLKKVNLEKYMPRLQARAKQLQNLDDGEEMEKHISAELRCLTAILKENGALKGHRFAGGDTQSTMILTTLSGKETYLRRAVDRQIGEGKTTCVKGGVRVVSSDYEKLMQVRCFQELLFVPRGMQNVGGTPQELVQRILQQGLVEYLEERLKGEDAYLFRVQVRGKMSVAARDTFVRQVSHWLERGSNHRLINAPNQYEVTLRFHKKAKEPEQYALYLQLAPLVDTRFAYRKHALATSIQPYVAALIMEMIQEDTAGRGQVLDPFCGVGTLLIERCYREHAHSLYGVDIYGQAVEWAQEQARQARMPIHYIHKDMADFSHTYPFELIVTNLPSVSAGLDERRVSELISTFLDRCQQWLAPGAFAAVYTQNPALFARALARQNGLGVRWETEMYKEGKSRLYLLVKLS